MSTRNSVTYFTFMLFLNDYKVKLKRYMYEVWGNAIPAGYKITACWYGIFRLTCVKGKVHVCHLAQK